MVHRHRVIRSLQDCYCLAFAKMKSCIASSPPFWIPMPHICAQLKAQQLAAGDVAMLRCMKEGSPRILVSGIERGAVPSKHPDAAVVAADGCIKEGRSTVMVCVVGV